MTKTRSVEVRERISRTLQLNPTRMTYDEETILLLRYDLEYNNATYLEVSQKYNVPKKYINSLATYKRRKHLVPSDFIHDNSLPSQEEMLKNYKIARESWKV